MSLINTEQFRRTREQIEAVSTCADLQAIAVEALEPLYEVQAKIAEEMAKIAPLLALLTVPSIDPQKIVDWITGLITDFLTPYVQPYYDYTAQLALLAAEVASLIAAIEAKRSELTNCTVPLPTPPVLP